LNLLVSRGGEQLVVRVHRPSVRPARLEAIEAARDRLDAAGVPCSARVPAHDGARWARADDRLVEVERYIPHNGRMNTPPRLARAGCRSWAASIPCSPTPKSARPKRPSHGTSMS